MIDLTEQHWSALWRASQFYRVKLNHDLALNLERTGLVEFHYGSGTYAITDKGRDALQLHLQHGL